MHAGKCFTIIFMESSEESVYLDRQEQVRFILESDLCYSLDHNYKRLLDKFLLLSGTTMQVVNITLSKINLSLLQDNEIQGDGKKIHEFKPDLTARRWIYLSTFFMMLFFLLFLIDLYYIKTLVLAYFGLVFMLIGLLIQLVFICRNGNMTKKRKTKSFVHDLQKLEQVKKHMLKILPERNLRLMTYGLQFKLGFDASVLELAFC